MLKVAFIIFVAIVAAIGWFWIVSKLCELFCWLGGMSVRKQFEKDEQEQTKAFYQEKLSMIVEDLAVIRSILSQKGKCHG
jgi:hypothetical protein